MAIITISTITRAKQDGRRSYDVEYQMRKGERFRNSPYVFELLRTSLTQDCSDNNSCATHHLQHWTILSRFHRLQLCYWVVMLIVFNILGLDLYTGWWAQAVVFFHSVHYAQSAHCAYLCSIRLFYHVCNGELNNNNNINNNSFVCDLDMWPYQLFLK